jgi:hypothetical protein
MNIVSSFEEFVNETLDKSNDVNTGIAVQKEQLNFWKKILIPTVYKDLEKWATENNDKAKNIYDIMRGSDLDNYIHNYFNSYTPSNKK